jgi:intracellular sulfur oxidation DsrE/DsrF family protein
MPQSEPVSRRGLVARLAAAGAAGFAAFRTGEALAADDGVPRVAYHLSDREKVQFVLGNIENHFKGMGGPDKVRIALVANGPALTAFASKDINPDVERRLRKVADMGLELGACGNTLDATKLTVADLVDGFTRVDEGGVVRLAKLQAEGWAYLRP